MNQEEIALDELFNIDPLSLEIMLAMNSLNSMRGIDAHVLTECMITAEETGDGLHKRLAEWFVMLGQVLPGNRWATWMALDWEVEQAITQYSGQTKKMLETLREHFNQAAAIDNGE